MEFIPTTCQWIDDEHVYCGKKTHINESWCDTHMAMVYQNVDIKKEAEYLKQVVDEQDVDTDVDPDDAFDGLDLEDLDDETEEDLDDDCT